MLDHSFAQPVRTLSGPSPSQKTTTQTISIYQEYTTNVPIFQHTISGYWHKPQYEPVWRKVCGSSTYLRCAPLTAYFLSSRRDTYPAQQPHAAVCLSFVKAKQDRRVGRSLCPSCASGFLKHITVHFSDSVCMAQRTQGKTSIKRGRHLGERKRLEVWEAYHFLRKQKFKLGAKAGLLSLCCCYL